VARLLALVVRALVLLVSLELSGLTGVAAAMIAIDAEGTGDCCSDCPLEKSGKECPPGCPACHCSHGATALPPLVAAPSVDAFVRNVSVPHLLSTQSAPRTPNLPGVYRPPRFALTFV